MDTKSLAHPAPPTTTDLDARREAILQRTTRGLLTFNTGRVHRLEGDDLWAVPSTRGGFYRVDLGTEVCSCEDFTFYGQDHGVPCRHVYAAAIARASCRNEVQVRSVGVAGDGLAFAGKHRSRTTPCAGCGLRFAPPDLVEMQDWHESLTYFDGEVVCRGCADGACVPY